MSLELNTALVGLPGVGQARGRALARLGLETAGDLLAYYPRSYEDRPGPGHQNSQIYRPDPGGQPLRRAAAAGYPPLPAL